MRPTASATFALPILLALAACAGNPKPGEEGYPYNLTGTYQAEFLVEGGTYRGSMNLATAPGGVVSGNFTVTEPTQIVGTVEGTIVADTVDFQMPYEILDNSCAGVVHGRGAIAEGGTGVTSPVRIDSCDAQLTGTMTLTR